MKPMFSANTDAVKREGIFQVKLDILGHADLGL